MAGVDVLEAALLVEDAVKHGRVAVFSAAFTKILIHARKNSGKRNIHRRGGEENALQQRGQQRRGNSFPGNIAHEKSEASAAEFEITSKQSPPTEWQESVEPATASSGNRAAISAAGASESGWQFRFRGPAAASPATTAKSAHSQSRSPLPAPASATLRGPRSENALDGTWLSRYSTPSNSPWRVEMVASSVSITGNLSIGIATTVCNSSRATLSCLAHAAGIFARIADDQFPPRLSPPASPRLRNRN